MIKSELILFNLNMTKVLKHNGELPALITDPFHIAEISILSESFKTVPMFVSGCVERIESSRLYFGFVTNSELDQHFTWHDIESEPAALKIKQVVDASNLSWFSPDWLTKFKENLLPNMDLGDFVQVRAWDRCFLMKAGGYFIKAVPKIFSHEPDVTGWLSEKRSDYIPEAVLVKNEEWLIMKDMPGTLLGYSKDPFHWITAAIQLSDIQREAVQHITDLKLLGCPERKVQETLTQHAATVFKQLSDEGFRLPDGLMYLSDLLKKADTLRIPLSIDHGDFFGGNCMNDNGRIRIFDWSDSSISHPFLSITVFLEEVEGLFDEKIVRELEEAYLLKWLEYGTINALREELTFIRMIEPFFYLIVYEAFIFPNCFFNWDRKEIIQSYLDKIEARVSRGDISE